MKTAVAWSGRCFHILAHCRPVTIVPHSNWHGTYGVGTYANGSTAGILDLTTVRWPADLGVYLAPTEPYAEDQPWIGALIGNIQDANGWLYRRNRYYDPQTGRFTQEDPIGIAGGAQPVCVRGGRRGLFHFIDPFGLCPKWRRDDAGNCPGGITVGEWEQVERASENLPRAERRRIRQLLNEGKVKKDVLDPDVPGEVRLREPGTIYLNTAFMYGSAFSLPTQDLAWLLVHESRHVRQLSGAFGSIGRMLSRMMATGNHATDPWELQAIHRACRAVETTLWRAWC